MVEILNKKKSHIINSSMYGKLAPNRIKDRNKQLFNIDDLIKNSILVETVDNIKKDKKPDVDKYLYFYTPIKDNDNIYLVKLFTEQGKNNKDNIVNLYDVITIKKMATDTSGSKSQLNSKSPSVITIKDILQNVKDFYGNKALPNFCLLLIFSI